MEIVGLLLKPKPKQQSGIASLLPRGAKLIGFLSFKCDVPNALSHWAGCFAGQGYVCLGGATL